MKTLGDVLRPTKGDSSYPQIANRANAWFRQQLDSGRPMGITRMSAEQVRRIFEDYTERPRMEYLEALAAVQSVDAKDLFQIAGYATGQTPEPEDLIRKYVERMRGQMDRPHMEASIRKILDEELRESGEPEL